MTETRETICTRTGDYKTRPVEYDPDAKAYVTTDKCEDCKSMFKVFPE